MNFATQWNPNPIEGELNCGISIVDPSGYVDPQTRIENLIRAGERLDYSRRELYDYGPDDPPDFESPMDPDRTPGYDLADAHRDRMALARKLSQQVLKSEEEPIPDPSEPADDSVAVQEPAGEVSNGS